MSTNKIFPPEAEIDIHFWYANHELCPTCLVNLRSLPPQANLIPHYYGLCLDAQYREVETEDERQKEALRKFHERERQKPVMPKWGAIIGGMLTIGAIGFVIWKIIDALPRFIEAWH